MKSYFRFLSPVFCMLTAAASVASAADGRVIADSGTSSYVIYVAPGAPLSVKEAAQELKKHLSAATGAELSVVKIPAEHMIALGDSPEARAAGIDPAALPEEGFRILTEGGKIFVVGRDTADGEFTAEGGTSCGTYYGAMEFLERFAGVRWLLPTLDGTDIPHHERLAVPDIDFSDAPAFRSRLGTRFWTGTAPDGSRLTNEEWTRRMRFADDRMDPCPQPLRLDYNHAWEEYGMDEELLKRPELMALFQGRRRAVTDAPDKALSNVKYATTNPKLIELFSSRLNDAIAKNPLKRMWSIGPSDGGGWCESPEAIALDETTDPAVWPGNIMYGSKSLTPRLIVFFNEVAKRVRAKHPDKVLGTFAYAAYTYPPSRPMEIEPNLFFMVAARPYYGYALYNPELAGEFFRLVEAWGRLLPGRTGWFDYSTWVGLNRINVGAPYPPGIALLKMIYPALKKNQYSAVFVDDNIVQGWGGLYAYLVGKLLWNPDADVDALADDWLKRAYGPGWRSMRQLYDLLEEKLSAYKRARRFDSQYRCVPEQVKEIHLPIFEEMERLYLEALAKAKTDAQRVRLEMFGDNFVLLHWNMRKAGWLADPKKSSFYRTDAEFEQFVNENYNRPSISKRPGEEERQVFLKPQLGVAAGADSVHE